MKVFVTSIFFWQPVLSAFAFCSVKNDDHLVGLRNAGDIVLSTLKLVPALLQVY